MKTALFQYNPTWERKEANKEKILRMLESDFRHSDLLVFPEMTLTGFTMSAKENAESKNESTFEFFSSLAKNYSVNIIYGYIEKYGDEFFNANVHLNRAGKIVQSYYKIHPFSYANEHEFYSEGKTPMVTSIDGWETGLSICYDLRFPELYRQYGKLKIPLIINIANWPITRIDHWRTLLKARAIENLCYVVGVNRTGIDPKSNYNGFSSVFDPTGDELAFLENEEGIIYADLNEKTVFDIQNKFPFLNDIRMI